MNEDVGERVGKKSSLEGMGERVGNKRCLGAGKNKFGMCQAGSESLGVFNATRDL